MFNESSEQYGMTDVAKKDIAKIESSRSVEEKADVFMKKINEILENMKLISKHKTQRESSWPGSALHEENIDFGKLSRLIGEMSKVLYENYGESARDFDEISEEAKEIFSIIIPKISTQPLEIAQNGFDSVSDLPLEEKTSLLHGLNEQIVLELSTLSNFIEEYDPEHALDYVQFILEQNLDEYKNKPIRFYNDSLARVFSWIFKQWNNGVEIPEKMKGELQEIIKKVREYDTTQQEPSLQHLSDKMILNVCHKFDRNSSEEERKDFLKKVREKLATFVLE